MAAGRGSRMKEYDGNKTLLPLIPGESTFVGSKPILMNIIGNLPAGPKALIVNFKKDEMIAATAGNGLVYCEQPELNGTGGALLAAETFLNDHLFEYLIITMGDVPFVKKETYLRLIEALSDKSMVVLGFRPKDKKQYGVLETEGQKVKRITEWKYWHKYSKEKQAELTLCNSGIYAARRDDILKYLPILASKPQIVQKEVNGKPTDIKEYFLTDIIEYMVKDGLAVGCVITDDENETMGVDDSAALKKAQEIYRSKSKSLMGHG